MQQYHRLQMRDKRHRCDTFANATERRRYISKKEIPDIEARIREQTERLAEYTKLIADTETKIGSLQKQALDEPQELEKQKAVLRQDLDAKERVRLFSS